MVVDSSVHGQMAGLTTYAKPLVTADKIGRLSMQWVTEDGVIKVTLDRIIRKSEILGALVRVYQRVIDDGEPDVWSQLIAPRRINLYSDSAVKSFVSSLRKRFLGPNWENLIDQVVICGEEFEVNSDQFINLRELAPSGPPEYLLERFAEKGQHTLIAAQGGGSKSLWGLACAISVASGKQVIPGLRPVDRQSKAMYLDWETTPDDHRSRMANLCVGVGIEEPVILYRKMDGPLGDYIDVIRDRVLSEGVELVVVDSVGMAAGGDVSDTAVGLEYMRTVRSIPCSLLSITHNPKDSDSVIGSVYFRNAPRYVFSLTKDQETHTDDVSIALVHTKANNSKIFPSRGYRIHFNNEVDGSGNEYATSITYHSEDLHINPVLAQKTTLRERIIGLLRNTGYLSTTEIAEKLDKTQDQARALMHREKSKKLPQWKQFNDKWGLVDRNHSETVTRNSYGKGRNPQDPLKGVPKGVTAPAPINEEIKITATLGLNSSTLVNEKTGETEDVEPMPW